MPWKVEVLPDAEAVAVRAARLVAERAVARVAAAGAFSLAVSGGRSPWATFALLGDEDVPWEHVTIYQVDERVAPDGDPRRNLTHLLGSLPPRAAGCVRAMPVSASDLAQGQQRTKTCSPLVSISSTSASARTGTLPLSSLATPCSTYPIATCGSPSRTTAHDA